MASYPADAGLSDMLANLDSFTFDEAESLVDLIGDTMPNVTCEIMKRKYPVPVGGCAAHFDRLLCWPPVKPETVTVLPCLAELNGISYNTSHNVSRWCLNNGSWDITNYSECHEIQYEVQHTETEDITTIIYFVGYITSLIALGCAVWIFLYFKDLRCLRNIIHTNLMCTYIFTDFIWILTLTLQMWFNTNFGTCVVLMMCLHYFHLTNFFWMFVEGLYLYMLVVETFHGENIKLRVYASIGWGCPTVFVLLWAIVKAFTVVDNSDTDKALAWKQCPWMQSHPYDWIFQAPAIGILLINLVFLFVIMFVLITKLRSAQTVETQQYRKAAKALLVLIPLLGITYVLVIAGPTQGVYKNIHEYVRAILISTQGFTVALFYCFLNTEVQNTIRHHKERWKTARSINSTRRYTYSSHSNSKDWSPRSRSESIRLTTPGYRKRESSASEITTTTLINVNGGNSRSTNGSSVQVRSPFLNPSGSENV